MSSKDYARRALDQYEGELARMSNVVGLGIVPASTEPGYKREMAVAVYVTQKQSEAELPADQRIPKTLEILSRKGPVSVKTRVIETGPVSLKTF